MRLKYYTIPSNNRELRLDGYPVSIPQYYTIPSNNRELRRRSKQFAVCSIIPYQVITGNYDVWTVKAHTVKIIPYQVITGNYDTKDEYGEATGIIPYQVITGNYDMT